MLDLDKLILDSVKNHNGVQTKAFREIKAGKLKLLTAKNAKEYDDSAEISLIKKILSEHTESYEQFKNANRVELMNDEENIINFLSSLLPKEPTDEEMFYTLKSLMLTDKISIPKAQMGFVINAMKKALPGANGKKIADLVKQYIND